MWHKFDSNSHLTLNVFPLIFLSKIHVPRDILWGELGRGISSYLNFFPPTQLKQKWGSIQPIPTYSVSRNNIFSTIFNNSLNMHFMHTFLMKLKYTIYYSSPNSFSYIVSKHLLHGEYEDPCLITR